MYQFYVNLGIFGLKVPNVQRYKMNKNSIIKIAIFWSSTHRTPIMNQSLVIFYTSSCRKNPGKKFMCRKKSIIVFLCIQYVNISCTTSESTMKFFDHTFFSLLIAPHFEICIISKEVIRVSARTIKINLIPNWDKYLSTNSTALKNNLF